MCFDCLISLLIHSFTLIFFFLLFTAAIAVFINPSLTPNPLILQIRASRLFAPH